MIYQEPEIFTGFNIKVYDQKDQEVDIDSLDQADLAQIIKDLAEKIYKMRFK